LPVIQPRDLLKPLSHPGLVARSQVALAQGLDRATVRQQPYAILPHGQERPSTRSLPIRELPLANAGHFRVMGFIGRVLLRMPTGMGQQRNVRGIAA
jgi:hypothetical protein